MFTSVSFIIDSLPVKKDAKILDIGAGVGRLAEFLSLKVPNGKVIAVELNQEKVKTLHNKNIKALAVNVDNGKPLPFRESSFDAVVLSHTLRHLIYRESCLKECKRVLKPGGILLVIESRNDSFGVATSSDTKIMFDDMLEYLDHAGFLLGENFDTKQDEYGIIGVCPLHSEE